MWFLEEGKASLFENECTTCTVVGCEDAAIIFKSDDKETGILKPLDSEKPKTGQCFSSREDAL